MEWTIILLAKWWLTLAMAAVIYGDTVRYTISNRLNVLILLSFFPIYMLSGAMLPPLQHATGFGAFFAVGFVLFSLRAMGGGDIKLLTALGLWCGWSQTGLQLAIYTGLFGGVLAIMLLVLRKILPYLQAKSGRAWKLPRMFIHDQPVPYGIAIAVAFLLLVWSGNVI